MVFTLNLIEQAVRALTSVRLRLQVRLLVIPHLIP